MVEVNEPTAATSYDYERLFDLLTRIANCTSKIDLSDRTAEGNKTAVGLASQIVADGIELRGILHSRQSEIEAGR